jgi:ribose 5-phosphate isomerase B
MKLIIGADHAGFQLKEKIKAQGKSLGVEFEDVGTFSEDSVHYPDFSQKLVKKVLEKNASALLEPCGVLVCGSGVGVSIAANRFKKIRAVNAVRADQAVLSRQHNASNVLCLGARLNSEAESLAILKAWLEAKFEGGRHQTRVDLMDC